MGKTPVYPKRIGNTRWIPHLLAALENFFKGYVAIIHHLEKLTETDSEATSTLKAKAKGILKSAKNLSLIKYAFFMKSAILPTLSKLSKNLQESALPLSGVYDLLWTTEKLLKSQEGKDNYGEFEGGRYSGILLVGDEIRFKAAHEKSLSDMQSALAARSASLKHPSVAATHIVDFKNWPDKANQNQFGEQEIASLCEHFGRFLADKDLDKSQITLEWEMFKLKIYVEAWEQRLQTVSWKEINRRYSSELPNILPLIDLVLTLPSTSADCERGFSAMKRIKTEQRSLLLPSTLNDLMMIHINSPSIPEFDPTASLNDWLSVKSRRVGSSTEAKDSESSDESSDSDCSIAMLEVESSDNESSNRNQ